MTGLAMIAGVLLAPAIRVLAVLALAARVVAGLSEAEAADGDQSSARGPAALTASSTPSS